MKTKEVNVGNIQGLSSYQLAVTSGKFTGTLEDYLNKEMSIYNDMVDYAYKAKSNMEDLLSSITDDSPSDLSEVINARGTYKTLANRLDVTDEQLDAILDKLNSIDPDSVNIDAIRLSGSKRNVEMRNNGVNIQWRIIGESNWIDLVPLKDLTPNFTIGKVETLESGAKPEVTLTGSLMNKEFNFKLPKGRDGVDGGIIVDTKVNEEGELIIVVENEESEEYIGVDDEGNKYIIPQFSIGNVTSVPHDQKPFVNITGTLTNPVLNFGIPKATPIKLKNAYVGEDGFLKFEFE